MRRRVFNKTQRNIKFFSVIIEKIYKKRNQENQLAHQFKILKTLYLISDLSEAVL